MLSFILILASLQFVLPEDNVMEPPSQLPPRPQQPIIKLLQQGRQPSLNLSDHYPFNVTISHLSPRSIEISWSCKDNTLNDRYEVTIKPVLASYKVVETVPNNMCYLLMDKLEPDTTYQVAVTSIAGRNRRRSGYVIFRTFIEDDYTEFAEDDGGDQLYDGSFTDPSSPSTENAKDRIRLPRVRLVEISLVGMAMVLWAGAIYLFFHRWGKIRMLLPYQPDYKEMKNSNASCTTCSLTPHHQCQKIHHLQNPGIPAPAECYQAPGVGLTTTYHHPYSHHTPHHLPHQPMSEPGPGPSCSGQNVNLVTVTESGCSPIRYKMPIFNDDGDISIEMALERRHLNSIHRKARSAEQLKQYVYPWDESADLECTEF